LIFALFFSSLYAQTPPNLTRKYETGFNLEIFNGIRNDYFLLSANYTYYLKRHGIMLGISDKILISSLNAGRNNAYSFGVQTGYKYAFRKPVSRRWQPYSLFSTSFFPKNLTFFFPRDYAKNVITSTIALGMNQRLCQHLNLDIALGIIAFNQYNTFANNTYLFSPSVKVGITHQFWK
jgi:hypothetical protein